MSGMIYDTDSRFTDPSNHLYDTITGGVGCDAPLLAGLKSCWSI